MPNNANSTDVKSRTAEQRRSENIKENSLPKKCHMTAYFYPDFPP
jgi:hypothetical protein